MSRLSSGHDIYSSDIEVNVQGQDRSNLKRISQQPPINLKPRVYSSPTVSCESEQQTKRNMWIGKPDIFYVIAGYVLFRINGAKYINRVNRVAALRFPLSAIMNIAYAYYAFVETNSSCVTLVGFAAFAIVYSHLIRSISNRLWSAENNNNVPVYMYFYLPKLLELLTNTVTIICLHDGGQLFKGGWLLFISVVCVLDSFLDGLQIVYYLVLCCRGI